MTYVSPRTTMRGPVRGRRCKLLRVLLLGYFWIPRRGAEWRVLPKYQIFAGEEVPQVDHGGGYDFGEHVVGADAVGKEPDEGVVECQPHHADGGEEEKLDQSVLEFRAVEYPQATDDVVDQQTRNSLLLNKSILKGILFFLKINNSCNIFADRYNSGYICEIRNI